MLSQCRRRGFESTAGTEQSCNHEFEALRVLALRNRLPEMLGAIGQPYGVTRY